MKVDKHVGKGEAITFLLFLPQGCLTCRDLRFWKLMRAAQAALVPLVDHDGASKTFYVGKVLVGNMEHPQELQAPRWLPWVGRRPVLFQVSSMINMINCHHFEDWGGMSENKAVPNSLYCKYNSLFTLMSLFTNLFRFVVYVPF